MLQKTWHSHVVIVSVTGLKFRIDSFSDMLKFNLNSSKVDLFDTYVKLYVYNSKAIRY